MPVVTLAAGRHKPRELLVAAGLAPSKSEAERLLRQRAVQAGRGGGRRRARTSRPPPGESFVLSVGAARFVRFVSNDGLGAA